MFILQNIELNKYVLKKAFKSWYTIKITSEQ